MPLDIVTIPCLSDNYAYLVKGPDSVYLIDAPEAGPILNALDARGWSLDTILITHHHHDHVGGIAELRERFGCEVIGPRAEEAKLPPMTRSVTGGDSFGNGEEEFSVIDVPGHTLGHVAYYLRRGHAVFTADSLMALGCGRVFEGTMPMMWDSLSALAALPPETMVYSGHEYTASNARFALTIEPDNATLKERCDAIAIAREHGEPTVPALLSLELATNPFLRADEPGIKENMGMVGEPAAKVFAEIRRRKDNF